ncbi:xylulokinase [uncultured Jatrophihabitans sp.]|uniref:xylulokinase n=1 Tax=uncultured Jatrophihabitans sp. TaxID=1610747 RepID=UPI0035CA1059
MALVAGVDSSTQSCKVHVVDADTGALVRSAAVAHPAGTEVDPQAWWTALQQAIAAAGGFADVAAVAVGAQQHGMVCLAEDGSVVRDALLWNDLRSAPAARALTEELPGGAGGWAAAVGSVLVASFTVTKLRWLAEHDPVALDRTAAVCLPHDWLTWQLGGRRELVTDRSDASGTGYWSPATGEYRDDLLRLACGARPDLPRVLAPAEQAGELAASAVVLGPGAGDNAAAALGTGLGPGDVLVSLGTSGVACGVGTAPTADPSGAVAGFADATGQFLPLVCTLNATRVLDAVATMLGVDLPTLSALALRADPGAQGVVLVPYWEGERTPDKPHSTGALHGLRLGNSTPANIARAAFEGVLCGLADGVDALRVQGLDARRIVLVGGGARSVAACTIASAVLGLAVVVPAVAESVARGAARQAAWVLSGADVAPDWPVPVRGEYEHPATPHVRERYAAARELTVDEPSSDRHA